MTMQNYTKEMRKEFAENIKKHYWQAGGFHRKILHGTCNFLAKHLNKMIPKQIDFL